MYGTAEFIRQPIVKNVSQNVFHSQTLFTGDKGEANIG